MTVTENELQDALYAVLQNIIAARDRIDDQCGDDALADIMHDTVSESENIYDCDTFTGAGVLTDNAGLVLKVNGGAEFQIIIVRSKAGGAA